MATPLTWPSVLIPSSEEWRANKGTSLGGGPNLINREQVVVGPTGIVTASLTVPCNTRDKVLEMRALIEGLDGRAGSILVGPMEVRRAPWFRDPLTGGAVTYGNGRRDAAIDPAYASNPDTSSTLDFRTSADVAVNAVAMTIQRNRGGLLRRGLWFSALGRLHMIVGLAAPDPGGAAPIGVTFRPWLRDPWPAGTPIEFGTPTGTMALASDDTGALTLQLSRSGTVTIDLIEAL